jgi:hypothetical protein
MSDDKPKRADDFCPKCKRLVKRVHDPCRSAQALTGCRRRARSHGGFFSAGASRAAGLL